MSTPASKSNITIALETEASKKQKRKKKSHADRSHSSRISRDMSEIKAISSQQMISKSKESELKANKMKRSAQGMITSSKINADIDFLCNHCRDFLITLYNIYGKFY